MMRWWQRLWRKTPWIKQNLRAEKLLQRQTRAAQETFLLQLLQQPRYADPRRLAHHEHQVFSQNGEDGILAEIFRRIGVRDRRFVEIGTGSGLENNTVYWLMQGWQGLWVEGSAKSVRLLTQRFQRCIAEERLRVVESFVTRESISTLLYDAGVPDEFDLFSLDVDQNTYWVWQALERFRPRVVVVEYNASIPAALDWKVAYDGSRCWDESNYFGASLKAYERLGEELGYHLVGCDLSGTNAFFVRHDLCGDHFAAPYTAEHHYEPPRYWLARTAGHPRGAGFFAEPGADSAVPRRLTSAPAACSTGPSD